MENKVNSTKLFELLDPMMYGVIMLSVRARMTECAERLNAALQESLGDVNDQMVQYWHTELEEARYTYNSLP